MNTFDFNEIKKIILPPELQWMEKARQYQDNLLKPIGSLGQLEEIAIRLCGIQRTLHPKVDKKAIVIFCADNGVYEEGVSMAPQEVTKTQTINFIRGITGVSVLAKQGNIDLKVVDIGICGQMQVKGVLEKKIANGTKNAAKGPAMTEKEVWQAISLGFSLAKDLKQEGYQVLGTGEMGIANTTTAASVIISLCGCDIDAAVGKGAGLTEEFFQKKKQVIAKILSINKPDQNDPIAVVQKVGGFDIAGMVGLYLGAAYYQMPIIIDGVISIAAALAAALWVPACKGYLFPSHQSEERGYKIAAEKLGITPYFQLGMRLGEGSGCPFTCYLMEAAIRIMEEMATFSEGNVDKSNYINIWEDRE